MSITNGVSFLWAFDLGNKDANNPGAKVISVTDTAAGDFDKKNLFTDALRQVWRSLNVTGWKEIVLQVDIAAEIDTFAILGHNLSSTAVIQIQANFSNDFTAPPETVTVPWTKFNSVNTSAFASAYNYYKVRILDPDNTCGFIEVGRIVAGRAIIMDVDENDITDSIEIATKDYGKTMQTEGFFRASNELVKARTVSIRFEKMKSVSNSIFTALREMYDTVGITKPFVTMVDRGDIGFCTIWGQLDDVPSESYTINRFVSMPLKISEVF